MTMGMCREYSTAMLMIGKEGLTGQAKAAAAAAEIYDDVIARLRETKAEPWQYSQILQMIATASMREAVEGCEWRCGGGGAGACAN